METRLGTICTQALRRVYNIPKDEDIEADLMDFAMAFGDLIHPDAYSDEDLERIFLENLTLYLGRNAPIPELITKDDIKGARADALRRLHEIGELSLARQQEYKSILEKNSKLGKTHRVDKKGDPSEQMYLFEMGPLPIRTLHNQRVVVKVNLNPMSSYAEIIEPTELVATIPLHAGLNDWVPCEGPIRPLSTSEYDALVAPYIAIQRAFSDARLGEFLERLKEFRAYNGVLLQFRNRIPELEVLLQKVNSYSPVIRWKAFDNLVKADSINKKN